jgi:hypothetical protein
MTVAAPRPGNRPACGVGAHEGAQHLHHGRFVAWEVDHQPFPAVDPADRMDSSLLLFSSS